MDRIIRMVIVQGRDYEHEHGLDGGCKDEKGIRAVRGEDLLR